MDILNLKNEPQHIEQLAHWHHEAWSYLNPSMSVHQRSEEMQEYLNPDLVPSTFIGKEESTLIGSAAILKNDMDTKKHLSPWLASVYVAKEFRRKGYGGELVMKVMKEAKQQGIKVLYLFTPSEEGFYKNLGWQAISKEQYRGESVTVMAVEL